MPNIEIKAKCHNLDEAFEIVDAAKTDYIGKLHQVDTYYETKEGRLKLREIDDVEAQLIPYYKEYSFGPMKSSYSVLPVSDKKNLKEILEKILGQVIVVDKQREVFLIDNVRVHLDQVKGLGTFIEFEAVYEEDSSSDKEKEVKKVAELKDLFHIEETDLLNKSYIDYFLSDETKILSPSLQVLFYFSNETLSILEIERMDVGRNEPLEKRYFWFLFDSNKQKLQHLEFISMNSDTEYQYRTLSNIDLKFNFEGAELKSFELDTFLYSKHPMFINKDLRKAIEQFLRSLTHV